MLLRVVHWLAILAQIRGTLSAGSIPWSYCDKYGATHWDEYFYTCSGSRQSPINIDPFTAIPKDIGSFKFINYDITPFLMEMINNGHTVNTFVELPGGLKPQIKGGGLDGTYILLQFHFHWGSCSVVGSEHTIDGKSCPLEVHFVHYKESYGDVTEALKHPDGLAVLGMLFDICLQDNLYYKHLTDALPNVINKDDKFNAVPIALEKFLPHDLWSFYRYEGGLTTPGCNEIVIWTVFQQKIYISEAQMEKFRALIDAHHLPLVDNFRPTQDLAGRDVYVNSNGHGAAFSLKEPNYICEEKKGTYIEETGDCFRALGKTKRLRHAEALCCSRKGKVWKYFLKFAQKYAKKSSLPDICGGTSDCSPYKHICELLAQYPNEKVWLGQDKSHTCYYMKLDSSGKPEHIDTGCYSLEYIKTICDLNLYPKKYCNKLDGMFSIKTCDCFYNLGKLPLKEAGKKCISLGGQIMLAVNRNVNFLKSHGIKPKKAWDVESCIKENIKSDKCYIADFTAKPPKVKPAKNCEDKEALAICQI